MSASLWALKPFINPIATVSKSTGDALDLQNLPGDPNTSSSLSSSDRASKSIGDALSWAKRET
eukprot:5531325-Karenia_brevis.AAC.1